jgi:hypothetical protein
VSDSGGTPPHGGTSSGGPDEVGSVAEEAAKLLGALSGWAREHGGSVGHSVSEAAQGAAHGAAGAAHEFNEHIATGSEECLYCPICRVVHYVRSTSPEVKTHLAIAASSLMQAASALMETQAPEHNDPAGVERIDLGDDSGDWPSPEDWSEDPE